MKFTLLHLAALGGLVAAAPLPPASSHLQARGSTPDILKADAFGTKMLKDHVLHHSTAQKVDVHDTDMASESSISFQPMPQSKPQPLPASQIAKRVVTPPGIGIKGASRRINGFAGKFKVFGGGKGASKNSLFKSNKNKNVVKDSSKGAGKNFKMNKKMFSNRHGRILSPKIKFAPKIIINRGD